MVMYRHKKSHKCDNQGKENSRMCDIAKLRGKIIENGINQAILAEKTGMSRSTLNRKMKTGEDFTIGEASKISSVLKLTKEESMSIFFAETVA
jgi:DNA-binding phage protein